MVDEQQRTDGRSLRWAAHNQTRRAELVDAALRAIRRHGAGVGMDEIAAEAGTSKTVIYRHFTDRAGLYRRVADKVERRIARQLQPALQGDSDMRTVIDSMVEVYLSLVEADPEVYRFVVRPPLLQSPVAEEQVGGITERLSALVADALQRELTPSRARVWSLALVGSVRSCADRWLASADPMPRQELRAELTELAWGGLSASAQIRAGTDQRRH